MADLIQFPENFKFRYTNSLLDKSFLLTSGLLRNKMFAYILVVIDCFSKKVWAEPLKRKSKEETGDALDKIFNSMPSFPTMCVTDDGRGNIFMHVNKKVSRIFKLKRSGNYAQVLNCSLSKTNKYSMESINS